jgi:MauM/NapG family ferredoxin protein
MTFQRILQTLSLGLFVFLLWQPSFPLDSILPVETFLKLDPLIFLGTGLSGRAIAASLFLFLMVLFTAVLLGRFYCGSICPFGITIDLAERFIAKKSLAPAEPPSRLRLLKYEFLLFILGASLFGTSLVYLGSPLSWITRLYGLLLHPMLYFLSDSAMMAVRPIANQWNMTSLAYVQITTPRYDFPWLTALFFVTIFGCARYSPRFWCRYLCPSGAILSFFASKPVLRRQVSKDCTHCGHCIRRCPMGAIDKDPRVTVHSECIVCETCVRICPANAISFKMTPFDQNRSARAFCPDRRKMLLAGLSGAGAALITLAGNRNIEGGSGPAMITRVEHIRPPGALPERDFLARCIGCGECMKACPTNTLQPAGPAGGLSGFFSPVPTPRLGPCVPHCNVCGQVCPTGAIRGLSLEEKTWAKIGTAHVLRHKCIAWEHGKKCLICAELCVYDALKFKMVPELSVAVPFVDENKCSGCGVCEHNCPVMARSAIIVEPMGALRLRSGSYRERGHEMGLSLSVRRKGTYESSLPGGGEHEETLDPAGLPPGFTD